MSSTTEQTIFVVEDDQASRELLEGLFASVNLPVRTYSSAQEFLDDLPETNLGCIVLDVRMPGMSGLTLHKELQTRSIELPVIFMTAHGDTAMAVRAMKAGAFDFIEKPIDNQSMLDTAQKALAHSAQAADEIAYRGEIKKKLDALTGRERNVLDLIIAGELNKQIAHVLGISQRTVEVHRANLMEKIGARSPADLVRMVMAVLPSTGNPQ